MKKPSSPKKRTPKQALDRVVEYGDEEPADEGTPSKKRARKSKAGNADADAGSVEIKAEKAEDVV